MALKTGGRRALMITPNNPLRTGMLAESRSLDYRRRIMVLANLSRLFFILASLVFAPFFLTHNIDFIWHREFVERNTILLFGCLYIVCLAALTLFAQRGRVNERLFIINALVDIFFALLFLVSLDIKDNWIWLIPFVVFSMALSLLTLNLVQCTVYALFVYLEMVGIYILWSIDRLNWQTPLASAVGESVFDLWKRHDGELLSAGIAFALLSLILFLIGYLANNARENGIMARLNNAFYEQSRSLNESIIAEMPSGLIVINVRNEIVTMNSLMRQRFRIQEDDAVPLYLNELSPLLARQLTRWLDLKHNDLQPLDLFGQTFTATFAPLPIEGYSPLILITLESIETSYQRVRETRLASLGRLTAGIAHEVRNPLGSIQSANELIGEWYPEDARIQMLCGKIQSNSQRINAIISNILDMFNDRPNAAQLLAINEFLHKAVEASRCDKDLENVPIVLSLEATADYAVYCDPDHLGQILHNLMLNAIKHGGREDVAISITTQVGEGGRSLYIDVADNGKGVPEHMREHIFEPFYSSRQGTGLGLYLVREMCLANQAYIVYVPRDKGACFRIIMERYLPEKPETDI